MTPRLRDHARAVDGAVFVGRGAEIAAVEALLSPASAVRVLLVWGPGGIGKSAMLRQAAYRAGRAARPVVAIETRGRSGSAEAMLAALDAVEPGSLVLVDETDGLGANLRPLRDGLLALPDSVRVVVAGRGRPDPGWWEGEFAAIVRELPLPPLPPEEARALLDALGVADPHRRAEVVDWALGSPLALVVAARAEQATPRAAPETELADRLAHLLAGGQLGGIDRALLEIAALTRAVDARLIAAALPGVRTRGSMAKLTALSVVESWDGRAVLHPVLARAIREELAARDPARSRLLTRRIADHLATRARLGDPVALFELTDLLRDPVIRSGSGLGASTTHYADRMRPGDLEAALSTVPEEDGRRVADWARALPEFVCAVRAVGGVLTGFALFAPADLVAAAGVDDPGFAPVLAWAAGLGGDPGRVLLGPVIVYLERDLEQAVETMRVGNSAVMMRAGVVDVRAFGFRALSASPVGAEFFAAMGYRPLDTRPGSLLWGGDFGPAGLVGRIHAAVLGELGISPGPDRHAAALLRDAARDPDARERLAELVAARFGDSEQERMLARVVELAHLSPGVGERAALAALHVSRATYYRLLRLARERLLAPGPTES